MAHMYGTRGPTTIPIIYHAPQRHRRLYMINRLLYHYMLLQSINTHICQLPSLTQNLYTAVSQ